MSDPVVMQVILCERCVFDRDVASVHLFGVSSIFTQPLMHAVIEIIGLPYGSGLRIQTKYANLAGQILWVNEPVEFSAQAGQPKHGNIIRIGVPRPDQPIQLQIYLNNEIIATRNFS
jgi:hypothetical protein